ncbi:MAG: GNAT family N-acetyltransferase [Nitrososphaerota archaeon]|nr:GNAT family N-acetyltransferase [Nitrososphaerota archaeon]
MPFHPDPGRRNAVILPPPQRRCAPAPLSTKELSKETWPDFQRLFGKRGEWGVCWCAYYQRARPIPPDETRGWSLERRAKRNREDKVALVEQGRAHGILVYVGDDPVGWCQYGPREELPRIDAARNYKALGLGGGRLWRITCLSVDRAHRGEGVARMALAAALKSIESQGGGTVEAYPVTHRGALAVWFGTQSMFARHGFRVVGPYGRSNVVMRKTVRRRPGSKVAGAKP